MPDVMYVLLRAEGDDLPETLAVPPCPFVHLRLDHRGVTTCGPCIELSISGRCHSACFRLTNHLFTP